MAEKIDVYEQQALVAIIEYMRTNFDETLPYKVRKAKEATQTRDFMPADKVSQFWEKCIDGLQKRAYDFTFNDFPDSCYFDSCDELDTSIAFENTYISEAPCVFDDSEDISSNVHWITPMKEFKNSYAKLKCFYAIPEEAEGQLDKLFERLCFKLEKESSLEAKNYQGKTLENIKFDYLPHMLDIQSKEVRRLLPYLLTAYTFNFRDSSFFRNKRALVNRVCGIDTKEITSVDAGKLRNRLGELSKIFSFSKSKSQPLQINEVESEHPLPVLYGTFGNTKMDDIKPPLVRYRSILDAIFECWSEAIVYSAYEIGLNELTNDIDFELCKKTYLSHLGENISGT